jgi:hypothetical protein
MASAAALASATSREWLGSCRGCYLSLFGDALPAGLGHEAEVAALRARAGAELAAMGLRADGAGDAVPLEPGKDTRCAPPPPPPVEAPAPLPAVSIAYTMRIRTCEFRAIPLPLFLECYDDLLQAAATLC